MSIGERAPEAGSQTKATTPPRAPAGDGRPGRPRALPVAEQRRLVIDAALSVFAADGYNGTTIERVAREAGTARSSVYELFPARTTCSSRSSRTRRAGRGPPQRGLPGLAGPAAARLRPPQLLDGVRPDRQRPRRRSPAPQRRAERRRAADGHGLGGRHPPPGPRRDQPATPAPASGPTSASRSARPASCCRTCTSAWRRWWRYPQADDPTWDRDALIDLLTEFTVGGLFRLALHPEALGTSPRAPTEAVVGAPSRHPGRPAGAPEVVVAEPLRSPACGGGRSRPRRRRPPRPSPACRAAPGWWPPTPAWPARGRWASGRPRRRRHGLGLAGRPWSRPPPPASLDRHPEAKDATDLDLAVDAALAGGPAAWSSSARTAAASTTCSSWWPCWPGPASPPSPSRRPRPGPPRGRPFRQARLAGASGRPGLAVARGRAGGRRDHRRACCTRWPTRTCPPAPARG